LIPVLKDGALESAVSGVTVGVVQHGQRLILTYGRGQT